jgi:hypothetical protein
MIKEKCQKYTAFNSSLLSRNIRVLTPKHGILNSGKMNSAWLFQFGRLSICTQWNFVIVNSGIYS